MAPTPSASSVLASMRDGIESRLAEIRTEITEAQDRLADVDDSGVPKAEYTARLNAWVDDMAQTFEREAEYGVSALRLPQPRPRDVHTLAVPVRGGGSYESIAVADAGPMLAFLFGDTLKAKLAEVIQASGYVEGPPTADRPAMRRSLLAELDRLELAEERLIAEAQDIGLDLPRRRDARPEIVLSLDLETAA